MTQAPTNQGTVARAAGPAATESTFEGVGGLALLARLWPSRGPARAAIALVHGLGEHVDRYAALVRALPEAGFALHGYDQRGHGRSPGQRGHVAAWSDYGADVGAFLEHIRGQEAVGTPIFLYGHSLGGGIVLEYGLRRPAGLAGVVSSSPALVPAGVRRPALEALAAALSRVWPSFSFELPLEDAALSRDPAVVAATRADPLSHRRISARATTESLAALEWTRDHAADWRLPLLIFHGTADRVIDPAGSIAFAEAAVAGGAPDVTLRLYEGSYHEPHNDLDAAAVMADVVAWLDGHVA